MPFYEYQCKNCGHELEAMQKINEAPLKKCPHCGKSQLQRLMSAPLFRLKGGGWYETDFKGDKDNRRNLADRPDAEAPKDTAKDDAKGVPAGADGKGKDKDGKASEGKVEAAAPKDKPADKSAEKASPEPAKKPDSAKRSSRARMASHGKSAAKRPIKRPVHKAKRRV
jgi:putative FmdB family regulatory protein